MDDMVEATIAEVQDEAMVDTVDASEAHPGEATRAAIVDALAHELAGVSDERLAAVADPQALGRSMVQLLPPAPGAFADLVGPVYSTRALEQMWGVSRAAISKRATSGTLFALKVEGVNVFPLFQFDGHEVRRDVVEITREMARSGVDPFTIAAWMRTPLPVSSDAMASSSPVDMVAQGRAEIVWEAARQVADAWAR
jgi:hypothetical protein